jgi:hypothetical protein
MQGFLVLALILAAAEVRAQCNTVACGGSIACPAVDCNFNNEPGVPPPNAVTLYVGSDAD